MEVIEVELETSYCFTGSSDEDTNADDSDTDDLVKEAW